MRLPLATGDGGRDKKLIRAIEADDRLGRPNCVECDDGLQRKRGCGKPGVDYIKDSTMVWRFTSPALHAMDDDAHMLHECPVGVALREAPQVFDAIRIANSAEHAGLAMLDAPMWAQSMAGLVGSERARLRELRQHDERTKRDASHGARVLRGRC